MGLDHALYRLAVTMSHFFRVGTRQFLAVGSKVPAVRFVIYKRFFKKSGLRAKWYLLHFVTAERSR